MSRRQKQRRPSLIRRLAWLVMLLTGGGAGGWAFKDHPQAQALWTLVMGDMPPDAPDAGSVGKLAATVVNEFKTRDVFDQPGTYQVKIQQVHLDPNLFKAGHTVDIQARVLKQDGQGRSKTVWDTSSFGERLAVAGKDELIAEWDHQPFQVEWSPGDRLTVEVYDRRPALFSPPKRFVMAPASSEAREFPLKAGTFPLRDEAQKPDPRVDPRNVSIILGSRRVGALRSPSHDRDRASSPATASRPNDDTIVIK